MTHLDLFTGILGFSLAAQWVWGEEYELAACCEIDPFCQKIIRKHHPEVPIIEDIKKVQWVIADGAAMFRQEEFGGEQDRILQQIQLPPIDLLTAGFPCQPFSCAGKRAGTEDDRYLWPETIRTIREVGPTYVVLENVAGLLSILEPSSLSEVEIKEIELFQQDESIEVGEIVERIHRRIISRVIDDLKQAGYLLPTLADGTPIILCLPACGVGAPHRRDRIWIIAHDNRSRCNGRSKQDDKDGERICENEYERQADPRSEVVRRDPIGIVADISKQRLGREESTSKLSGEEQGLFTQCDWWSVEPDVGRVAHGVPNRVDRLKSLGNAIVPQVAMQIFKAIKEINS